MCSTAMPSGGSELMIIGNGFFSSWSWMLSPPTASSSGWYMHNVQKKIGVSAGSMCNASSDSIAATVSLTLPAQEWDTISRTGLPVGVISSTTEQPRDLLVIEGYDAPTEGAVSREGLDPPAF